MLECWGYAGGGGLFVQVLVWAMGGGGFSYKFWLGVCVCELVDVRVKLGT